MPSNSTPTPSSPDTSHRADWRAASLDGNSESNQLPLSYMRGAWKRSTGSPELEWKFSSDFSACVFLCVFVNCLVFLASAISEPFQFQSLSVRDRNFHQRAKLMQHRLSEYRLGMPFEVEEATQFVFQNTRHVERREVTFLENWIQWTLGQFYSPALEVQDTARLMRGGFASCSQRAQILKSLAESAGHRCRFVGLEGHVVLEIEVDGVWKLADPDYGVAYDFDLEAVQSPDRERDIRQKLRAMNWRGRNIENYIEIVQSANDNRRLQIGSPLSPRLYLFEQICRWLVLLTPIPFIVVLKAIGFRFN